MFKQIRTKKKTICVLAGILLVLIVWAAWGNTALELNTYTISSRELPDAFDGYRIAQVSDLHNAAFGGGNQRLLDILREAEPDMIAITGDLIDSRKTNLAVALALAEEAVRIAPCYDVSGIGVNDPGFHADYLTSDVAVMDRKLSALASEDAGLITDRKWF